MMRQAAEEAGRDPSKIEVGVSVNFAGNTLRDMLEFAEKWEEIGATRLIVRSVGAGFKNVNDHLEAIRRFIEATSK